VVRAQIFLIPQALPQFDQNINQYPKNPRSPQAWSTQLQHHKSPPYPPNLLHAEIKIKPTIDIECGRPVPGLAINTPPQAKSRDGGERHVSCGKKATRSSHTRAHGINHHIRPLWETPKSPRRHAAALAVPQIPLHFAG